MKMEKVIEKCGQIIGFAMAGLLLILQVNLYVKLPDEVWLRVGVVFALLVIALMTLGGFFEDTLMRLLFRVHFGMFPPLTKYNWIAMKVTQQVVDLGLSRTRTAKAYAKEKMRETTKDYQWIKDEPPIENAGRAKFEIKRLVNWSPGRFYFE
jgi:hypothetical protein